MHEMCESAILDRRVDQESKVSCPAEPCDVRTLIAADVAIRSESVRVVSLRV